MGALWKESRIWEFQFPTVKSALLCQKRAVALTNYSILHTDLSHFEKFLPTRLSNFKIISHIHCYLDSTLIRHLRVHF